MPQASDELRDLIKAHFGGSLDTHGPERLLKQAGYTLNKDWTWTMPPGRTELLPLEAVCMSFLVEEWDYGDIAKS